MIAAADRIEKIAAWKKHLKPQRVPGVEGWEWAVHSSDNAWPGGDHFDLMTLNPKQWLVFLADASGHGGAAAVMAAMARMVLHSCPLTSVVDRAPFCPIHGITQTPPIILSRLNRVLVENSLDEQFMTAFLGVWSPHEARMDYVVAGHELPRYWRQARRQVEPLPAHAGLPLGISPNETYAVSHVTMDPGDAMVLFTDGLLEARDPQGTMFGVARVDGVILEHAGDGAAAIKAGLLNALQVHRLGAMPQDDITFLVLKRWA
jgi:sigma-B regulation protein RsbU (phosphoserine phosphatase)